MKRKSFLSTALENLSEAEGNQEDQTTATGGEATAEATPAALSEEDMAIVEQESEAEAEATAEAQELETAVEELETELTDATDDASRVAEVADHLEQSAENGGATPEAMAAIEVATEGLLAKYDMSLAHVMPSMESFADMKTRATQVKYTAESFSGKAKELGEKIMAGIRAMIKWLSDLFAKYLTVAGRLEARALKIKEAAGKATDAKQQEVDFGGFLSAAKNLAIKGALPTDVAASVEDVVQRAFKATGLAAEIGRVIDNAGKVAKDAAAGVKEEAAKKSVEESEKRYSGFFEKSAQSIGASKNNIMAVTSAGFELPNDYTFVTEVLPGNKVIWGYRDQGNHGLSRFGIAKAEQEFKKQKVKTLSIEQINKLADTAIQAASLKKVLSDVEGKIRNLGKQVGTETVKSSEGFTETTKNLIWVIREGLSMAGAFHRPAVQVALAAASAGLDLSAASLKVYGATPAKEEAKKDDKEGNEKK